jgi:hypothetical protein
MRYWELTLLICEVMQVKRGWHTPENERKRRIKT